MRDRIIDIVVWILIAVFGLVTAYVTFGILSSQASTEVQGYSVEGALAGFIVSAGVLTSLYLQVRKSSGELQELQRHNRELQDKLLRGAPHPQGFETEVAERERIVLARPGDWKPTGGVIFDYRLPLEELQNDDQFPPQFQLTYQPIEDGNSKSRRRSRDSNKDQMQYYKDLQDEVKESDIYKKYWASYSAEYVMLGDQAQPIKSLKFIAREYVHIEITQPDRIGDRKSLRWWCITKDEYESQKDEPAQQEEVEGAKEVESGPIQSKSVLPRKSGTSGLFVIASRSRQRSSSIAGTISAASWSQVTNSTRFWAPSGSSPEDQPVATPSLLDFRSS